MIIKSNSIISLSAALLALGMSNLGGSQPHLAYALFLFFSTLFIYTLLRMIKVHFNPTSKQVIHYRNEQVTYTYIAITSVVFAGVIYFVNHFFIDKQLNTLLIIGSIISVLYALPFVFKSGVKLALRDMPYLKLFLIGVVWSLLCFYYPTRFHPYNVQLTFSGFLFIISITIPFDIRDLPFDNPNQKTIPQLLGWKAAKLIAILLNGLFFVFIAFLFPQLYKSIFFWLICATHLFVLQHVHPSRSHRFYGFFVDGLIGLTGLYFWYAA